MTKKLKILKKTIKFYFKVLRTAKNPRLKDQSIAKSIVMLYGFFGRNLGDDVFFDLILKRYPDTVFVVYDAVGYDGFFENYPNVYCYQKSDEHAMTIDRVGKRFGRDDAFEKLLLSKCDAVVHIGGSIYQQIFDWQTDIKMRAKRYRRRRPFFSISSNFGPYKTDEYYAFWRKKFKASHDICFRDKYSYNLFSDVKSVRYVPDLLFALPKHETQSVKDRLFVSVINPFVSDQSFDNGLCEGYMKTVTEVVQKWLQAGKSVCLSSFCELQQDLVAIERIINAVPEDLRKNIVVENYVHNQGYENVLKAIAQSEYVLATRFHAMLLGLVAKRAVLPITYSQKLTHALEDIGFDGIVHTMQSFASTDSDTVIEQILNQKPFDVARQQNDAQKQFEKLDRLISRKGGRVI